MSNDEIDIKMEESYNKFMSHNTDEGYNEFLKEYGLRESWCNKTWNEWDDLFCEIKTYWKTKAVRNWFYLSQIFKSDRIP